MCKSLVSEFFLNRIAKGKLSYLAKTNVLYFCEPRQCAKDGNSQNLANRKQDIFSLKTTFIHFNLAVKALPHVLQSLAKN